MWTALLLPTCIHKLFWRIARQSAIALEVFDGMQHEVSDAKPDNDEAGEYYVPE